jgi:hypothetical protein
VDGQLKCHSIELPWHNNEPSVSCIPEGTYECEKHISDHLGNCLHVLNVPKRADILIHPANNAIKELRGCIAPVTVLTGPGMGDKSKIQVNDIVNQAYAELAKGEAVTLTIIKKG